jgi:hypothetical protein
VYGLHSSGRVLVDKAYCHCVLAAPVTETPQLEESAVQPLPAGWNAILLPEPTPQGPWTPSVSLRGGLVLRALAVGRSSF